MRQWATTKFRRPISARELYVVKTRRAIIALWRWRKKSSTIKISNGLAPQNGMDIGGS